MMLQSCLIFLFAYLILAYVLSLDSILKILDYLIAFFKYYDNLTFSRLLLFLVLLTDLQFCSILIKYSLFRDHNDFLKAIVFVLM